MTLTIQNLSLEAIIGILPFERENPQRIIIDAELEYDYKGDYLNYADLVDLILLKMKEERYGLLEDALEDLITNLKIHFPMILSISLSIKKPDILSNCIVGVRKKEIF